MSSILGRACKSEHGNAPGFGLRVALVNPPYRAPQYGPDAWIHVPPQGYGGIQWAVAMLADGLLELGCEVTILGAPGSTIWRSRLHFPDAGDFESVQSWIQANEVDIVHDHSNGVAVDLEGRDAPLMSTHHLTGAPKAAANVVFLSTSQSQAAGKRNAPIVRLPVNLDRFQPMPKGDYLLFLGRISPWKGAFEAAAFAASVNRRLVLAGPAWEREYFDKIVATYGDFVSWHGEVGGDERRRLLAEAHAVLVLSQPVDGPWGGKWLEPGAMVVAEAAASGTPVVATANGCLAEIVPHVGVIVETGVICADAARAALEALPSSETVRRAASDWNHVTIANQYLDLYQHRVVGRELPI